MTPFLSLHFFQLNLSHTFSKFSSLALSQGYSWKWTEPFHKPMTSFYDHSCHFCPWTGRCVLHLFIPLTSIGKHPVHWFSSFGDCGLGTYRGDSFAEGVMAQVSGWTFSWEEWDGLFREEARPSVPLRQALPALYSIPKTQWWANRPTRMGGKCRMGFYFLINTMLYYQGN